MKWPEPVFKTYLSRDSGRFPGLCRVYILLRQLAHRPVRFGWNPLSPPPLRASSGTDFVA